MKANKTLSFSIFFIVLFTFSLVFAPIANAKTNAFSINNIENKIDRVIISVNKVKGAKKYTFYRREKGVKKWTTIAKNKVNSKFTDYKTKDNTVYYYKVKAYNSSNNIIATTKSKKVKTKKWIISDEVKRTINLLNQERKKAGVKPLSLNIDLCKGSMVRAYECKKVFEHIRPDGSSIWPEYKRYKQYKDSFGGENLCDISNEGDWPKFAVDAWMNSPGHRRNMLHKDFTKVGLYFLEHDGIAVIGVMSFSN